MTFLWLVILKLMLCAHKFPLCSWALHDVLRHVRHALVDLVFMSLPFKSSPVHVVPAQVVPYKHTTNYGVRWVWDKTCWDDMSRVEYLRGELMKIGATCAGTTCVLGVLVTGSLWTLGRLVRGQHVFWEYLSQGGHEHWGELSKGTVVQGRFKVVSTFCVIKSL